MMSHEGLWVEKGEEHFHSAPGMKAQNVQEEKSQQKTNKCTWDSPLNFYTLFRGKKGLITQVKP